MKKIFLFSFLLLAASFFTLIFSFFLLKKSVSSPTTKHYSTSTTASLPAKKPAQQAPSLFSFFLRQRRQPITPAIYDRLLGVGLNVNWVTFPKEEKYFNFQEAKAIRQIGFTHVRIRFKESSSPQELDQKLHHAVNIALKARLIPIIAFGAKNFNENPNQKTLKQALKVWQNVAASFKNYPYLLSYDLIIEPGKKLNKHPELLNEFYQEAIKEIRRQDPHRLIFLAPLHCSSPYYLNQLHFPPHDDYLLAEWHFYAAGPSKKNKNKLWTTGTKKEKELIIAKIAAAKKWSQKNHILLWVGAWMPGNYNHGNNYSPAEQIKFASFMAGQLAANHIPFALNADGQFYNAKDKKWISQRLPVLQAIFRAYYGKTLAQE